MVIITICKGRLVNIVKKDLPWINVGHISQLGRIDVDNIPKPTRICANYVLQLISKLCQIIFINFLSSFLILMMSRDPKEERLNWGLDWSDYLTSQRDFIVGRLEEHLDSDQVAFEDQEELGQATVARAHAVLRF